MLIIDSREKKFDHIKRYLDKHGIYYRIEKLDAGDYMSEQNPNVTVDRKQNLDEIAGNLCTKDNNRFWRELRRANQSKVKLYVLIEQRGIKGIQDVQKWHSEHSRITGYQVASEMMRAELSYNVEFLFCDKLSTGKRICELLGVR